MARPRLIWAAPALEDLDDIAAFIALDNPDAASRLVTTILGAVERLRDHPASGRWVPEAPNKTHREIIVSPCRIIYRRQRSDILIVSVIRGERLLRPSRLK